MSEKIDQRKIISFNDRKGKAKERIKTKKMIESLKRGMVYTINKKISCLFALENSENNKGEFTRFKEKLFSSGSFIGLTLSDSENEKRLVFRGVAGGQKGLFFITFKSLLGKKFVRKNKK